MKKENENYNKKIFISNIIMFLILLSGFYIVNSHLNELNYELQYRDYLKYGETANEYKINYSEIFNNTNNTTETENYKKIDLTLLKIVVAVYLILILNTLYYIIQRIFDNYNNNKKLFS